MIDKQTVRNMYSEHISMLNIAKHLGVTRQAIQQTIHKMGITRPQRRRKKKNCQTCHKSFNSKNLKFCCRECYMSRSKKLMSINDFFDKRIQ